MNLIVGLVSGRFKALFYRRNNASHDGASHAIQADQTDGQDANGTIVAHPATSVQDHSDATLGCFEAFLLLFRAPKLPVKEKLSSPVETSNGNTVPQQNSEKRDITPNPTPGEGDHGFAARQDTVEQRNQTAPLEMQVEVVPSQAETETQQVASRVVDIRPDVMQGTGSVETMDDSHVPPAGQDEAASYAQPTPILKEDNLDRNEAPPDTHHSAHSGETLDFTVHTNRVRQPRKKGAHPESSTNGGKQPRKKRDVEEGDPPPSESSTIRQKEPRKKPEVQRNDDQPSTSREPGKNVEESPAD